MPTDDPGSLSSRQTADVMAFIFSQNGFPAGKADLPDDDAGLKPLTIDDGKKP